jgi:glutathionyl-hydroquinone reductase
MSVVDPVRDDRGWRFGHGPGFSPDPVNGFDHLSGAYHASDPDFDGRITVPVLWGRETERIVNNESADVVRMLHSAWDEWGDASVDFNHIKRHYYVTHDSMNPTGIVPKGPELDLTKPHDRG